jgi:hypothetical protein
MVSLEFSANGYVSPIKDAVVPTVITGVGLESTMEDG